MTTFLLVIALLVGAGLALMTFLAAAVRHTPLSAADNLPDTSPVQQWTEQQIKYFRANAGLQRLRADVLASDPGDEQPESPQPEDAYSKKLRLNAEHEAELKGRKQARSTYHKAWYQLNKDARKAQVNARAQDIRKAAKRDEVNQRRRVAQLAYWTPERKAEQSRLTVERMAAKAGPAAVAPVVSPVTAPAAAAPVPAPRRPYGSNQAKNRNNPNYLEVLAQAREQRRLNAAAQGKDVRPYTRRNLKVTTTEHGRKAYEKEYRLTARATGTTATTFSRIPEPTPVLTPEQAPLTYTYGQRALA